MRNSAYIAAGLGWLVGLVVEPGAVFAQTYKVSIQTEPPGASLWIDERDGDPVGETPYSDRLPAGRHTLFLQLQGHVIAVEEITVAKRRRGTQKFRFELVEQSLGSIDVLAQDGATATEGAKVYLDGEQVGTVPDSFDATEGAHQLEVFKEGYKRYESWVEVEKGGSVEVMVALEPVDTAPVDIGDGDGTDGPGPVDGPDISAPGPAHSGPTVRVNAGLGAGWRRFEYDDPGDRLRPYSANGIALVHVTGELYLGSLVTALSRVSAFGGASLSLPVESVTEDGQIAIATSWFRREIGLRGRFGVGPGTLGLDAAEGGNAFTFDNAGLLADEIAQAEYEYVRVGAWYGVESDRSSFGGGADGIAVLSSKGVAERFDDASVFGARAHGWYRRHLFAGVEGAVTASLTYFDYTLVPNANYVASGSYDLMIDIMGSAGYRF